MDIVASPAVLVDLGRVRQNIERGQKAADTASIKLRPHIKTHKIATIARWQVAAGAVGITCQKLGEAEAMARAGLRDIFISYNIVGGDKLRRLRELAAHARLSVGADSLSIIDGYVDAATHATPLTVLVECDTGMRRCGVPRPQEALALAQAILERENITFGGLFTYPPLGFYTKAEMWLAEALELFRRAGIAVPVVSSGGTPDMWSAISPGILTEYRPGTYVYMDRYQVHHGAATMANCALTVRCTVVSRPAPDRAIIDAGTKILSSDTLGLDGYGVVLGHPDASIVALNEEHGMISLSRSSCTPHVGDRLDIVPNHACVVSNLVDEIYAVKGNSALKWSVDARGQVD